jgi:hypothetical protein
MKASSHTPQPKWKTLPILAIAAVFAIASLSFAATETDQRFVGYRHEGVVVGSLPNGAVDLGGGLLSDRDYGVARFALGGKYLLWLEKITRRNARGEPEWRVKDVLTFDALKKSQQFFFSYSFPCRQNKKQDLDMIVLAERSPKTKGFVVRKAWRANVEKEVFENVPVTGIVCR